MSKDLPPAKLTAFAQSLTGKERAFLAIDYINKEKKDGKNYDEETKLIQATISPYRDNPERQEFIFYWELWRNLCFLSLDLQTNILLLRATHRQLDIAKSIFVSSCLVRHIYLTFRWMPKIYTSEQFEQIYKKVREEHLSETMPLMQIARHEAFLSLQQQGYLDPKDDQEGVIEWYEEDSKKTLEELVAEKAKSIKNYLDDEERRKKRGAVAVGEDLYSEYLGLEMPKIEEKVKELGVITKPPAEEVERWNQELALQEAKLRDLIKEGKLTAITVTNSFGWYHNGEEYIGTEGITAQSWYDYPDKLDKNFNGYIDEQHQLVEFSEGEFLIASGGIAGYVKDGEENCSAEKTRLRVLDQLNDYQHIKESEDGQLDITSEDLKSAFIERIGEAQRAIKRIKEHAEVIKRAKTEFFDDVVEIADELVNEGESLIQEVTTGLQDTLDYVRKDYSLLAFFRDVNWTDKDKYKINPDIEIDEEWVEKTIDDLVGYSNKECYGNFKRNPVLQSTKK